MSDQDVKDFHFDLWKQPWIGLEKSTGEIEKLSIEDTLLNAHRYSGIFDPSPLVLVGIHRFLMAILQDIFSPTAEEELRKLWNLQEIPKDLVVEFGKKYGDRFDLFSREKPFFQSGDVSSVPIKGENIKSIAYLAPDIPSGTENTHYRHGGQATQIFCPSCCAAGLICIPAFSTSGGAGIKPSINGVPPIYVLPVGQTLLNSLMLSLTIPTYQPQVKSIDHDLAWWKRAPIIPRSSEVVNVGYLHSLTFQARRVRLYPEKMDGFCTRCGTQITWGVKKMIFDMGESRPKNSPSWFDPFAAYKIPDTKPPIPIRPVEGKAAWREYSSLFLRKKDDQQTKSKGRSKDKTIRPSFLDQIADLTEGEMNSIPLRCIGLRTDMKAKIFEWVDTGFEIPTDLLQNEIAGYWIDKGLDFSRACASTISSVFRKSFSGSSLSSDRYGQLKNEMMDEYWRGLAIPFREWVLNVSSDKEYDQLYANWIDQVIREANHAFASAAASIGDEGNQLKKRFQGEKLCRIYLSSSKKKELTND
jgi:CRISPR system Cascade subunit CasA